MNNNLKKLRKKILIECLIFLVMVIFPLLALILFKIPIPPAWLPWFFWLLVADSLIFGLLAYFHIRELRRIRGRGVK